MEEDACNKTMETCDVTFIHWDVVLKPEDCTPHPQEFAPESRSVERCIGEVLLVLIVTWAKNTLQTCLEGMEPQMGCTDLGFSHQTAPIFAGLSHLTLLLTD